MDGMNANTKESRKKFLVPLLVLLLCAVSLTGAAYAYSSSVTVNNNTVSGEEFVLEMYNKEGSVISAPITVDAIRITPDTAIGDENKVVVKAEANTKGGANVYAGTLKIIDTKVTSADAIRTLTFDKTITTGNGIINASDLTEKGAIGDGSIGYEIELKVYKTKAGSNYSDEVTSGTATSFAFGADHSVTLHYVITVTATNTDGGITFDNTTPKVDADNVKTLFDAENKFILEFSAAEE